MLRRLSRRAVETLEFRGVLVVLALAAGAILYVSLFTGHRPKVDDDTAPTVPVGETSAPSRR